jgi:hypothetical protein
MPGRETTRTLRCIVRRGIDLYVNQGGSTARLISGYNSNFSGSILQNTTRQHACKLTSLLGLGPNVSHVIRYGTVLYCSACVDVDVSSKVYCTVEAVERFFFITCDTTIKVSFAPFSILA